jgi:Fe-S oxidoreductase
MDKSIENEGPLEENPPAGPTEGSLSSSSTEQRDKMFKALKEDPDGQHAYLMKNACVHCGLCADSCHYYLSSGDPELIPAVKAEKLSRALRKEASPFGRKKDLLGSEQREALFKAAFQDCSLCGRCTLSCPVGLSTRRAMYAARTMFSSIEDLPPGLDGPVQTALEVGNYIDMSTEDFVENIEWIAEEVGEEIEIEDLSVPIDKEGAEWLYIPHPLEARDYPMLLMAVVKILHAAGEDYTFSSHAYDTANYAFYQGNRENTRRIVKRVLEGKQKLGAKGIVQSPCGHGYRVMRWEAEGLLGESLDFPVLTMSQMLDRYIREGRIQLIKDAVEGPFTYHDPCNIGRLGGVIEEPRRVMNAVTSQFVEMEPHGVWNLCCGGGGGLAATADYGQKRVQAGKAKADQIRETGAKIVVTNCYNCMTQVRELNKAYELGIEVKSIVELVADSMKT